jgi:tRNA G18 (ribose-2'-O)-methylase SpoU
VYSVEQVEGSKKLHELSLSEAHGVTDCSASAKEGCSRYAVVFGNEVKGVHQSVVDASDGCLEIPQFGTKHSLNVSVTAGIVVWEFAKRWKM